MKNRVDVEAVKEKNGIEHISKIHKSNDVSNLSGGIRQLVDIVIHMTAAIVSFMAVAYAVDYVSLVAQKWHISLCACGYQLLMTEAILLKSEGSTWSQVLSGKQRRTLHWVLHILGSGMAIAGTVIRINLNAEHFITLHGTFGILAMICNIISLVNGLTSLYAVEMSKIMNGLLSKLTHIFFGSATLIFGSVSLCYGFLKNGYITWSSQVLVNVLIGLTSLLTFLVLIRPCFTFIGKSKSALSS